MVDQLYDEMGRQAHTQGEKLEMIALKSLAVGNQDDLFKEFGFEANKVTFEAERFLGKEIKKNPKDGATTGSRLDKPSVVTENPFAQDLVELSDEAAVNFFDTLAAQPTKPVEEPK